MKSAEATKGAQFEDLRYLERFSRLVEKGKTLLDAGCGDGIPVDDYLVKRGLAVNGIDVSARMIELARKNVPEGFFEVRDILDLKEGEYCVDGIVSLRAMRHIPREKHRRLVEIFASYMSNGGTLLLTMASDKWQAIEEDAHGGTATWRYDVADSNIELIESIGFAIILDDLAGSEDKTYQTILARS